MSCDLFGTFKTLLWLFYFRNMSFFIFCNELITKNRVFPCSSTQCVMYDTPPQPLCDLKKNVKNEISNHWISETKEFSLLIIWPGSFLADINLGLIRYVLHEENVQETMDNFKFLVKDSKPNVVSDNVFHIQWSLISFEHKRSVLCVRLLTKPACFRPLLGLLLIQRWNTHYFH